MDKRVVLAVAGSGKTSLIIDRLDLGNRFLIITYTISNCDHIRNRVIRKFGYFPENIHVFTYFSFLYSFCFKPFLVKTLGVKGINHEPCRSRFTIGLNRYIDAYGRVYANRLVKLIETQESMDLVVQRLSKYFDEILIDEIQDFAGHDFNLLKHIAVADTSVICVGDFYQHTFDTSRDGNVNGGLYDDYDGYIEKINRIGYRHDVETLKRSYRCSSNICEFVTKKMGIKIESFRDVNTDIRLVEEEREAKDLFSNDEIVKLFYRDQRKYPCRARNWGECKGADNYQDICVVLNENSFKHFNENRLQDLPPQTKNKLYVAITRARNNLYFVREKMYSHYKKQE